MSNRLYKIVHLEDFNWMPLIQGVDLVSLDGDLNGEGSPFVLRLRCADGAKIPPHWHPTDENITMLQGTLLMRAAALRTDSPSSSVPGGIT